MALLAFTCDRCGMTIVSGAVVAGLLCALYAWTHLGFMTDRTAVLNSPEPYQQRYMALKREFGVDDEIAIVAAGPHPTRNREVIDRIAAALRKDPAHFRAILEKTDLSFLRDRALLFLTVPALRDLERHLSAVTGVLGGVLRKPGLVPLFTELDSRLEQGVHAAVSAALQGIPAVTNRDDMRQLADVIPLLEQIVNGMQASLSGNVPYTSPWMSLHPSTSKTDAGASGTANLKTTHYFSWKNGHMYVMLAIPVLDRGSHTTGEAALAAIAPVLRKVRAEFPDVEIGETGAAAMEHDDLVVSSADGRRAVLICGCGILLLFLFTLRPLTRPLLVCACLLLSMAFTMGFTALVIGRLNTLSLNALPVLVGLGLNFGLQFVCRYADERKRGREPLVAMVVTMRSTGSTVLVAGFTTSAAFFAMGVNEFQGLRELAVILGTGTLFTVLTMLTVYPSARIIFEKRDPKVSIDAPLPAARAFATDTPSHPHAVVLLTALTTVLAMYGLCHLDFDTNMLHLEAHGTPAVVWEERLATASGHGELYAGIVANNIRQARVMVDRVRRQPSVADVTSPVEMIPPNQKAKIPVIQRIQQLTETLPPLAALQPVNVKELRDRLHTLRNLLLLVYPEAASIAGDAEGVRRLVFSIDTLLGNTTDATPAAALSSYQQQMFGDLKDKLSMLRGNGPIRPIRVQDIPKATRDYMVSKSGQILLRVFPRDDSWDAAPMKQFIRAVTVVDPNPTGTAVQVTMLMASLQRSIKISVACAIVAIVLTLYASFRSLLLVALTLLPLTLNLIWLGGFLGLAGIALNPANSLAISLMIGISVVNAVSVVRRCQEEGCAAPFNCSTGRAILTSNAAVGIFSCSLMTAHYRGMASLGVVMTGAVIFCSVSALFVLPAIMEILLECYPRHLLHCREKRRQSVITTP